MPSRTSISIVPGANESVNSYSMNSSHGIVLCSSTVTFGPLVLGQRSSSVGSAPPGTEMALSVMPTSANWPPKLWLACFQSNR